MPLVGPSHHNRSQSGGMAAEASPSALAAALEAVGDRWTLLVVDALLDGPQRFNDLQARVEGIASNILAQRLRRLEGEGLVIAQPYSQRPPRVVYELTGAGRGLAGALRMLAGWGAGRPEAGQPPRHDACGSLVQARWWCPTCERPVADDEAGDVHWL